MTEMTFFTLGRGVESDNASVNFSSHIGKLRWRQKHLFPSSFEEREREEMVDEKKRTTSGGVKHP